MFGRMELHELDFKLGKITTLFISLYIDCYINYMYRLIQIETNNLYTLNQIETKKVSQ